MEEPKPGTLALTTTMFDCPRRNSDESFMRGYANKNPGPDRPTFNVDTVNGRSLVMILRRSKIWTDEVPCYVVLHEEHLYVYHIDNLLFDRRLLSVEDDE